MSIKERVKSILPLGLMQTAKSVRNRLLERATVGDFLFDHKTKVGADIASKYNYEGNIIGFFADNTIGVVHKWHHYIPIYDRYFSNFRGKNVRFLEIGVSKGGSLQMWRKYFGPAAVIYGIDIDPACRIYDGVAGNVRIGSQDDAVFLKSVIDEMGGIDIVLDDGSHHMKHIPVSLEVLFGRLSDGGLYMIEDLHSAYWRSYGGGYRSRRNFFNYLRDLMDDMHHWYHGRAAVHPLVSTTCTGMHIHDSIVILEKGRVYRPTHSVIGG